MMSYRTKFKQVSGGESTGKVFNVTETCDLCSSTDNSVIYDAKIPILHQWAWACEKCFTTYNAELGIGKGQRYERVN